MNKIETFKYETSMGKVTSLGRLHFQFLNDKEFEGLDELGYSGGYANGTLVKYLNSLDRGLFEIKLIRSGDGDWTATYLLVRVIEEEPEIKEGRFPASMAKAIADKAGMEMKRVYVDEYDKIIECVQRQAGKNNYFFFIKEISSYVYEMLMEDGYVIDEPDYEMEDDNYCIKWI